MIRHIISEDPTRPREKARPRTLHTCHSPHARTAQRATQCTHSLPPPFNGEGGNLTDHQTYAPGLELPSLCVMGRAALHFSTRPRSSAPVVCVS